MIEIGRMVVKLAGRDAGKKAVIVDILDNNYVLLDGETRRRKCNINHIEPLKDKIKIKKGASHAQVAEEFKKLGLSVRTTKPKPKTERPRKKRKTPKELKAQKEQRKKENVKKKEKGIEKKREEKTGKVKKKEMKKKEKKKS